MTGPFNSVLGLKTEVAIHRFMQQTPHRYKIAEEDLRLCGVVVSVQVETGKATDIQRINVP
jgi:calcineurin-like phosphoesterase